VPTNQEFSAWGPYEARGLRIVLGCLGLLAVIGGAVASIPLFVWAAIQRAPNPSPFPTEALLGLVPALASIAIGAWAWRGRRVRSLLWGFAIFAGLTALVVVAAMVSMALLLFQQP